MNSQDLARFEQWIEYFATDAELELSFEKQVEAHILWLSGIEEAEILLEQIPTEVLTKQ